MYNYEFVTMESNPGNLFSKNKICFCLSSNSTNSRSYANATQPTIATYFRSPVRPFPIQPTRDDEEEFMIFLINSRVARPPKQNNQRTIKRCADSVWLNCLIFTRGFNLFS